MKQINLYTVKQVKESGGLYNLDSTIIKSPAYAANVIQTVLDLNSETVEKFGILTLNTKMKVVGIHILHIGSLNMSIVDVRSVFQAALLNNACSIICFHNHPSGDPTPSAEDIDVTQKLVDAGKIMGIDVIDQIVVGDNGRYVSIKEYVKE